MRNVDDMLNTVIAKMAYRNIEVDKVEWINGKYNAVVYTKGAGIYVLKYSPQWFAAGQYAKGLGKGAGMTFNLATYLKLSLLPNKPYMMFGFPESDHIYYQTWDEFTRLSEALPQPNGEEVRVILTKSLKRF